MQKLPQAFKIRAWCIGAGVLFQYSTAIAFVSAPMVSMDKQDVPIIGLPEPSSRIYD